MNDTDDPSQLKEDEGSILKNGYIRNIGKFIKRNGTILVGNDSGNTAIDGACSWTTPGGVKYQLRMTGGALQYLDTATWTNMDTGFTSGLPTEFVAANGKLYIFNGTENTHSWDGAAVTLNACLTDMGTAIPTGKYAVYWKNYMIVWGTVKYSGNIYKGRAYFSNLGNPDTFTTATDYFGVNEKDGYDGTGLYGIDKFLLLGKERSVHILTGDNPSEWILSASVNNLVIVDGSIGVASHRSMKQFGNDIWYLGTDGYVHSAVRNENGATPLVGIVSRKVQGLQTLGGMNKAQMSKACAEVFDGRYYLAFPYGSSTYNNRIVVADSTITLNEPYNPYPWVLYTGWNPSCFYIHTPSTTPQLYYGEASADSLTFQAETGSDDNDNAIDFDYQSGMIDVNKPEMDKRYVFIITSGDSGGNYDVDVSASTDGVVFDSLGTMNLNAGSVWDTGVWDTAMWGYESEIQKKFNVHTRGSKIMIRQRNNQANQPITINSYTLALRPKKTR